MCQKGGTRPLTKFRNMQSPANDISGHGGPDLALRTALRLVIFASFALYFHLLH